MNIHTPLLLLLTVVTLLAAHYFPHWAEWTGRKLPDPVRLVVNYAAGTVAWFGPFSVWLWVTGASSAGGVPPSAQREVLVGWLFLAVAGLTVMGAYWYDHVIRERQALRDLQERIELLVQQRQDEHEQGAGLRQNGNRES